ncbi:MAG: BMP family ABC transporter substrate-binding protein, partial [Firmicutes bacterium]|nr:BMP family ABC transporter substrate-binding protein [Bacillota bacterium]
MKKSISLLLVLALILSVFVALVGCGSEESTEGDALSVCIVASAGFGDKSFNDSALAGGEQLKEDLGIQLHTMECRGENFKQNLMDAAENYDVIVPVGWEFWEITEVAAEYPDTKFIWVDNVADG